MKAYMLFTSVLITVALITAGCTKDDDVENEDPPPAGGCRIAKLIQPSIQQTYSFDESGRITQVSYDDGAQEIYTYSGNTTTIVRTRSGNFEQRKIITANGDGLATEVRFENNPGGTQGNVFRYTYNGTELIQSIQENLNGGNPTTTGYVWQDGNLIEIVSKFSTTTLEYYTDKPSVLGNYLDLVDLTQGYDNFRTKNMVKSLGTTSTLTTITYTFDAAGNAAFLAFSGNSTSSIGVNYECD